MVILKSEQIVSSRSLQKFTNSSPLTETIKAKSLHFLVHPGFIYEDHEREPSESSGWYVPYGKSLLERYVQKARTLENDSLFIVLLHLNAVSFSSFNLTSAKREILETLGLIESIIGNRLFVFDASFKIFDSHRPPLIPVVSSLVSIAYSRGYELTDSVKTEFFGETLGECVENAALYVHRIARLKKKAEILVRLCSYEPFGELNGPEVRDHIRQSQSENQNLKYSLA